MAIKTPNDIRKWLPGRFERYGPRRVVNPREFEQKGPEPSISHEDYAKSLGPIEREFEEEQPIAPHMRERGFGELLGEMRAGITENYFDRLARQAKQPKRASAQIPDVRTENVPEEALEVGGPDYTDETADEVFEQDDIEGPSTGAKKEQSLERLFTLNLGRMSDEQFKKYSERLKGTVVDPETGEEHQTYPKLFEYLISRVGKPLPEEEPGKFQGKVSPSVLARKFEVELPSEDGEGLEEGPQGKQTSTRQFVEDEPFDLRFAKYVTSKGKIPGRRKPEIFETRKAKPEERMERLMYPKGLTKAPSYALTEPDPTGGGEYVLNPESPSMSGLGNESVDITSLHEIPPKQKQLNPVYQTGDVGAEGSPEESMHKLLLQKQALGSSPEQQLENLLQGIVPEQEERTLRPLPNPKPDLGESPAFTRKSVNILKGRASRLRSPLSRKTRTLPPEEEKQKKKAKMEAQRASASKMTKEQKQAQDAYIRARIESILQQKLKGK